MTITARKTMDVIKQDWYCARTYLVEFIAKILGNKPGPRQKRLLFVEDSENAYRCIQRYDPELADLYISNPAIIEDFIIEELRIQHFEIRRFGIESQLRKFGLPADRPVQQSHGLSIYEGNAAKIGMALQLGELNTDEFAKVVISSSDSKIISIIQHLQEKGISVDVLAFGPNKHLKAIGEKLLAEEKVFARLNELKIIKNNNKTSPRSLKNRNPELFEQMRCCIKGYMCEHKGGISISVAGAILRRQYGAHESNWQGYRSCKSLCMALLGGQVFLSESGYWLFLKQNESVNIDAPPIVVPEPFKKIGVPEELDWKIYRSIFQELSALYHRYDSISTKYAVRYLKQYLKEEYSVPRSALKFLVGKTIKAGGQLRYHPTPEELAGQYVRSVLECCKRSGIKTSKKDRDVFDALVAW